MSTFRSCINDGVREGLIREQDANEINTMFDQLSGEYRGNMANASADARAAADTLATIRRQRSETRRRKLLQARNWRNIETILDTHKTVFGRQDPADAAKALLGHVRDQRFSSVESRTAAVRGLALKKMDDVLASFKRNIFGSTQNKAQQKNMVRELFGENTGDTAAREMAQAFYGANEMLRKRFNAAGGAIQKLVNYGLPQIHRAEAIRKVSVDEWTDFTMRELDIEGMIDEQTGLPFNEVRLREVVKEIYATITQNGLNKVQPGGVLQGRAMANRRQDHRFLKFKNADAWLRYQERFGNVDAFDTMISHISSMSRDIAMMEVLGPNPLTTINAIKTALDKRVMETGKGQTRANIAKYEIDTLYRAHMGTLNAPISGFFANSMAGVRNILTSAQLGATFFTAITDLNSQSLARKFNGLPQVKTLNQMIGFINPLKAKERGKLATRLGLIADHWTTIASAQMRYVGEISGPEFTRRISDLIMRGSLLSPWTQAGRWAFGQQFLGTIADNVDKSFAQLDKGVRGAFERYGFSAGDWEIIRQTELLDYEGATFFDVQKLIERTDIDAGEAERLGTRILEMINSETEFAVPTGSMRSRNALLAGTKPGTLGGEILRSFAMYKNFAVTIVNTHLFRGVAELKNNKKGGYLAQFIITGTVLAAFGMQMKEIAKGRDPRPMDDPKFWGQALLASGGLGLYGDFLFSNINRNERGIASTVAGPVVGFGNDLVNLTFGNLLQLTQGEDTNFAAEAIKFTKNYMPGSSLWYGRLTMERLLWDNLSTMADPKVKAKRRRLEKRQKRLYGNKYWWRPGRNAPRRGPDFDNLVR
tara:strand:- start:1116 stop:3581 length:2466 start_codon:yes stop_codon:yes gene_type:complete